MKLNVHVNLACLNLICFKEFYRKGMHRINLKLILNNPPLTILQLVEVYLLQHTP